MLDGERAPGWWQASSEWSRHDAPELWRGAAARGVALAQHALGEALRDGTCGSPADPEQAVAWLTLAAQQHSPSAAFALAELLLELADECAEVGNGGAAAELRRLELRADARGWLRECASHHHEEAAALLREMAEGVR